MQLRTPVLIMVLLVAGMCRGGEVGAAGIETLVMPGKLVQGHAKYEAECSKCHQPFSKQDQDQLCLDCHENVAADVRGKSGYHGRIADGKRACNTCHEEHKGRDARIAQFNRETFDHGRTDYPLQGAHVHAGCVNCHPVGKQYRDAARACSDCHHDDDVHKGHLGNDCGNCHDERTWRKHAFDHDKTGYRLLGEHVRVACDSCHALQRYKDTPKACNDCHRFNDVHAGRFGNRCGECHNERGWRAISFDHDRNTDYPLSGRHARVACASCHAGNGFEQKLPRDCLACHRDVDPHKGSYGNRCDTCHSTSGWGKQRFDHTRDTHFPLRGRHQTVACAACHRGTAGKDKPGRTCIDCHRINDVHAGRQGERCDRCHSADGWARQLRFEHDMTRFPLIGLHAVVPCEECHLGATYTDAGRRCFDCHEQDDAHHARLGDDCAACHTPNSWSLWIFDHKEKTGFELDGGHAGIACESCHSKPPGSHFSISSSCNSCHGADDVHDGRFGSYCERCHNTESFKAVSVR